MERLMGLLIAFTLGMTGASQAVAQSAYGCTDLAGRNDLPTIEGKNGVFFRVDPDMRMFHAFSDETVERVAELSAALAETGTQLVYLPVPTKSLAMPDHLTGESEDLGFDPDLATTVYLDIVKRLEEAGVATADVRAPMLAQRGGQPPYHAADQRWTAEGARLAAGAVANRIGAVKVLANLQRASFATAPGAAVTLDSPMRAKIQRRCLQTVPPVQAVAFGTTLTQGATMGRDTSIFGQGGLGLSRIVVVGTEFTGEPTSNFVGFLSQATGLEVVQYNVPGGGAFAAISSYLASDAFQAGRPAVLVWEVPVEANLARLGDQPMRELIAAAGNTCRVPLNLFSTGQANQVRVDLNALDPGLDYTLFVDAGGAPAPEATFTFRALDGMTRSRTILRHPDQILNGRFFMPMSGLWAEGARSVDIEIPVGFGANPRVTACFYSGKG